jgi:hypothetical protein
MLPVPGILAGFVLLALLLAWSRWLAGRRWASAGHLLLASTLGTATALGWSMASFLESYEVQVTDRPVTELFFECVGTNRYRVTLTRLPSGRMQVVELVGDEWRLDLHALGWSERVAHLGAKPRYRIEALASRPSPAAGPSVHVGVTHDLGPREESVPWLAAAGMRGGQPVITMRDLAGPWQPMAGGARFDVRLTAAHTVLVDPLNAVARDSVAAR